MYTLFYKKIIFPTNAEHSHFSSDFKLKKKLWVYSYIIAHAISVFECIWCLDGV